jgi:hypothetical protein
MAHWLPMFTYNDAVSRLQGDRRALPGENECASGVGGKKEDVAMKVSKLFQSQSGGQAAVAAPAGGGRRAPRGPRGVSPEIHADKTVTLRLHTQRNVVNNALPQALEFVWLGYTPRRP